jgi:hypothetical protein
MIIHPAVIVHGLGDANAALAPRLPVTLLSAPGAALFAGCAWWAAIVAAARAANPNTEAMDILDCADASGMAMGALRSGLCRLILWPEAPGWDAVAAVAEQAGGFILTESPPALDLSRRNAIRQIHSWLRVPNAPGR